MRGNKQQDPRGRAPGMKPAGGWKEDALSALPGLLRQLVGCTAAKQSNLQNNGELMLRPAQTTGAANSLWSLFKAC